MLALVDRPMYEAKQGEKNLFVQQVHDDGSLSA